MVRMKQLSGLDATFLHLESPQMPMHVGALHLFELPAGARGRFVTRLRAHIASRLPLAPVLRRRLKAMPLNLANPAWVDAEPDLRAHIVELRLPAAAKQGDGMAALEAAVGELHAVLLDRSRPLWKMHVLEGLAPGANGLGRVALFTQFHHAAVDGQAAVALAQVLMDLQPEGRDLALRPSARSKVFELGMVQMLRGAIAGQAVQLARIVRNLPGTVGTLADAAGQALSASALLRDAGAKAVSNLTLAPRTVFNCNVGEGRSFAALSLPLAPLKAVARANDATLNDVVLLLCGTALRRYLASHGGVPRKSLVAAVPITLRQKGDTRSDNQASMSLVSLGTQLSDLRRRFAHVRSATAAMKSTMGSLKSVLPTDFPSIGVPWLMSAARALYGKARVAERVPQLANVVISNVPGPAVPLYMAGARMVGNYPTSIVVHGLALNITVQSYDQQLDFGLVADLKSTPDVRALADAIRSAYDDLPLLAPEPRTEAAPTGSVRGLARTGAQVLGQVRRRVTGKVAATVGEAVGGAVGGAVNSAVRSAMRGAVRGVVKGGLVAAAEVAAAGRAPRTARAAPVPARRPPATAEAPGGPPARKGAAPVKSSRTTDGGSPAVAARPWRRAR